MAYSAKVYEKVKTEMEQFKITQIWKRDIRLKEVYEKLPDIEEIDKEISSMVSSMVQLILENPGRASEFTEMAKEIIKLGMYIGLGGAVTFKNAVKPCEVAKFVPSDRLLIETDAPYMTPVPFRGKRCDSLHIPYTAEKIAELRGVSAQEILDLTDKNARTLFNIG